MSQTYELTPAIAHSLHGPEHGARDWKFRLMMCNRASASHPSGAFVRVMAHMVLGVQMVSYKEVDPVSRS